MQFLRLMVAAVSLLMEARVVQYCYPFLNLCINIYYTRLALSIPPPPTNTSDTAIALYHCATLVDVLFGHVFSALTDLLLHLHSWIFVCTLTIVCSFIV